MKSENRLFFCETGHRLLSDTRSTITTVFASLYMPTSDVKTAKRLGLKTFHSRLDTSDPFECLRI